MESKKNAPKNASELNIFLNNVLSDVEKGNIDDEKANVLAKIADKINKNVLNQVIYQKAKGGVMKIKFLES